MSTVYELKLRSNDRCKEEYGDIDLFSFENWSISVGLTNRLISKELHVFHVALFIYFKRANKGVIKEVQKNIIIMATYFPLENMSILVTN